MTCPTCRGHGVTVTECWDREAGPGMTEDVEEDCTRCVDGVLTCRQCDEAAVGVSATTKKALCVVCLAEELIAADMRRVGLAGQVVARASKAATHG